MWTKRGRKRLLETILVLSVQNYFQPQPRSNPWFISVHTHSISHLIPTILNHCAMTQWKAKLENYLNLTIYFLVTALDSSNHITLTDNCLYLISCLTNCSLITSYATLSNGVPRNIPRVNCIFSVNTQDFISYQTTENTATIAMNAINLQRRRGGWFRVRFTVFLFSDWMCFLWHGINS